MLIPAAQYAFVFWFLVGNNNGLMQHMSQMEAEDQTIYRIAVCTSKCIQRHQSEQQMTHEADRNNQQQQQQENQFKKSVFEICFDYCDNASNTTNGLQITLKKIYENLSLSLVCRDDDSLTFRIDNALKSSSTTSKLVARRLQPPDDTTYENSTTTTTKATIMGQLIQTIYFVKIHNSNKIEKLYIYLSDENFFTVRKLRENTTYSLTVVAVHSNNEYSVIAKGQEYVTLKRGYTPGMVTDVQIRKFYANPNNSMQLSAKLSWKPAADMTCHYNIICFSPKDMEFDMTPHEIRNPQQLYVYNLENLTFSTSYRVGIRAKNSNNGAKESLLYWKSFESPSCVEWFNYNFNICAPFRPAGLEVEQIYVGENSYALNITWQLPKYPPDYYSLRVLDLDRNGYSCTYNISKQWTTLYIPNITLTGSMYEVHLTACTPGGNATATVTDMTKTIVVVPDKNHVVKLIAAIFAPIFCIAILSLTTFIICHRRAKLKRYQQRCKYFEELEKKAPIDPKATFDFPTKSLPILTSPDDLTQFQLDLEEKIFFNDAMEIDRNDVTLYEELGQGAFGLVRRGIYNDNKLGPREVAVKMLKDQPSMDDVRAFRREIEVMKSVEKHPNIVGIIGHCTKRYNEMMLLTEYCSFGNLLDFLRDEWKYLYELNLKSRVKDLPRATINSHLQSLRRTRSNGSQQQYGDNYEQHKYKESGNPKPHGIFNIDVGLIEKLRKKYKCLGTSLQSDQAKQHTNLTETTATTAATSFTSISATDNKSYGYDETCPSAWKCQMNAPTTDVEVNGKCIDSPPMKGLVSSENSKIDASNSLHTDVLASRASDTTQQPTTDTTIELMNCKCRRHEQLILAHKNKRNTTMTTFAPSQFSVENKTYFKYAPDITAQTRIHNHAGNSKGEDGLSASIKREPLSAADLLDIAKQVAVGMDFLAKNKVVHRDLAARNVLVAPDRTVKIADFGLSRDVYQENIYKKTGNGKLPIKWLALESMTHQVYTTHSDVWSYGILLYEIVTLGGTPYPTVPTNRLLHILKTGYRMERPRNCGQEFYNLMHSCWHTNPSERPNFSEIIKTIDNFLLDGPEQQIDTQISVPRLSKVTAVKEDDSYLKPL